MSRNRWIWTITLALAALSLWALFPAGDFSKPNLTLGLDLQGGTYLKLEVETDKIPRDANGKPAVAPDEAVIRALEVVRNRLDPEGIKELLIHREGERHVVIQLPGDKDPERTQALVGQTAQLHLKLVSERYAIADLVDANGNTKKGAPQDVEVLLDRESHGRMVVEKDVLLSGDAIKTAKVDFGQNQFGKPVVSFELNSEGAGRFARLTEENVGRRLAIVLDGVIQSAPRIKSRIGGGSGIIEGDFSRQDAMDLALVLRSGALPAPMRIINKYVVGPTLGADTIRMGYHAALIGLACVLGYMILYYRVSGLIANIAMLFNLVFLLGAMAYTKSTLTLPGIAGIVLTMGMSVDANVIIFERVREELRSGKTVRAAIDAGYGHAFWTIFDSHVTSLITALILFTFGTGPIKGFAVSLSVGVAISLFTALYITKAIFDARKRYDALSI